MPLAFSSGSYTNRDRWASTWPLRPGQAGWPLVPVGDTNRDQKASTRQHLAEAEFFLKGAGLGVNLGCYVHQPRRIHEQAQKEIILSFINEHP